MRVSTASVLAAAAGTLAGCGASAPEATHTVTVERTVTESAPPVAERTASPPRPRIRLATYTSADFSARVPAGWRNEEDQVDHDGYVRSSWFDPEHPDTTVLLDVSRGETTPAPDKARAVMALTSRTAGYAELSSGPRRVAGRDGYRWAFSLDGTTRVDYFLNDCGTGIAVMGTAPPRRFRRLASTFARVANSVRVDCEQPEPEPEPVAEPAPEPAACHPSYEGACLDPAMGDYDCENGTGDGPGYTGAVTVVGPDEYDLDRDGDGTGCDW